MTSKPMKKPLKTEIMTIPEASLKLKGKLSPRQIRYLIEKGKISSALLGTYNVVHFGELKDYYNDKYSL